MSGSQGKAKLKGAQANLKTPETFRVKREHNAHCTVWVEH